MSRDPASELARLEQFILEKFPLELTEDEGVVDAAIRLMTRMHRETRIQLVADQIFR